MREHHAYRVPISLMYDAPVDSGRRPSELGPIDFAAPPREDDPISQILASRPPVAAFGRYWSDQVMRGHQALAQIDPARYFEVRFEDLIAQPREVLGAIARFFELPGDAPGSRAERRWCAACRPRASARWPGGARGAGRGMPAGHAAARARLTGPAAEDACRRTASPW